MNKNQNSYHPGGTSKHQKSKLQDSDNLISSYLQATQNQMQKPG